MFVNRMWSVFIVILTFTEEAFNAIEDVLRVGFIKSVVILIKLLLECFFVGIRNGLHIFFIKQRYFEDERTENVPDISDSSALFDSSQKFEHILKENTFFYEIFWEDIFGNELDIAY